MQNMLVQLQTVRRVHSGRSLPSWSRTVEGEAMVLNGTTIEQDEDSCKLCNVGKIRCLDIWGDENHEQWAFQLQQCFPVRKLYCRLLSSHTTTGLQWWGKRGRSFWRPQSQCRAGAKRSLHMLLFISQGFNLEWGWESWCLTSCTIYESTEALDRLSTDIRKNWPRFFPWIIEIYKTANQGDHQSKKNETFQVWPAPRWTSSWRHNF